MQSFAKQKMKTFDSFIIDIVAFTDKVHIEVFIYFFKTKFFFIKFLQILFCPIFSKVSTEFQGEVLFMVSISASNIRS